MSMVPSEAYFDGDPDGERADKVVSGFIVTVMMFVLATGFAAVAFFATQQMRGGVSVASASEVLSRVAKAPAAAVETPTTETVATNTDRQPPPVENTADLGIGAQDGAVMATTPVPSVKPARTRPPTVTFDSSILDDVDPPASEVASSETAPEESQTREPSTPSPPPLETAPVETASADVAMAPSDPPIEQEPAVAAPALPDPPVIAQPEEAQTPPAVSQTADSTPVDALSGTHLVQVGSFRSTDEAAADWRRIERRFPDLLASKARHVAMADLGERGVFHRLRIGPFGSVEEARTHCQALKDGGQDCLAVRQ